MDACVDGGLLLQMTRNMEDLLQKRQEEEEQEDLELELESRKVNELKRCKKTVASCVVSESEDSLDSEDKSDQLILSIADVKVSSLVTVVTEVGFHALFTFNKKDILN